jgi:hypothetical protein
MTYIVREEEEQMIVIRDRIVHVKNIFYVAK